MPREMISKKVLVLFIGLILISTAAYSAEFANPQLLVSPGEIEKNAGKWVVIDCRDEKAYAAGHIPGAITLGGACGRVLRDATLRVRKTEELEKLLGGAGANMDKPIVVYADARLVTSASVAFWVLEYLGHDKVYFLNGGIETWKESGKPLDKTGTTLAPATFTAKIAKSRIATTDEMVKIGKGELIGVNVIDSRTEKEHKGTDIRALRGGNIPNTTLNLSHLNVYDVQTGRIHSMDDLEALLGKLDKAKRTIPYCQTGTRSTLLYLVLRLMGFKDPANYDDSWIVYGSNVLYPAANENWYDFVRVNDLLKTVEEMQKELDKLKQP